MPTNEKWTICRGCRCWVNYLAHWRMAEPAAGHHRQCARSLKRRRANIQLDAATLIRAADEIASESERPLALAAKS